MLNAVVTGGSRGLELGIVRLLAKTGYRVIAIARRESEELAVAMQESRAHTGELHFVPFDLGKTDELPNLVRRLRSEFGRLDSLVNNAAIGTSGILAITPDSMIADLFRINVLSPVVLSKYVVRAMMADGGGRRIVNIASVVADKGYSGLAAYSATKSALVGFTRSLARRSRLAGHHGKCGCPRVCRHRHDAEHGRCRTRSNCQAKRSAPVAANRGDRRGGRVPAERPVGKNITGTTLTVDAGNTV